MSYRDTDPQHTPTQREADDLAAQCHAIIEIMRRKRLACKLLRAALDGLRLANNYKDPEDAHKRMPTRKKQPSIIVADLLKQ